MRTLSSVQAAGISFGKFLNLKLFSGVLTFTFPVRKDMEYLPVPAALFVSVSI
jgi:hypothetical protein